jgi:hypothetical protein
MYPSNTYKCKKAMDKDYPNIKSSFKEKVCKILNNETIVNRLINEKPYIITEPIEIYPNKYINFLDGLAIGLGYYKENNKFEFMLYNDIEPLLDEILAKK